MKGWQDTNTKFLYIFPQTADEIPYVPEDTVVIYVQQEDLAAWVAENETYASLMQAYNYNLLAVRKKVWADHIDDDLEPPVVDYNITYTGDTSYVTGPSTGAAGATITLTPTTAAQFADITLTSSDATITKNTEDWTFTMPEADVAISVAYNANRISKSGNTITLTLVNTTQFTDPLIAELVDEQALFGYCSQIIYANNTALDYYIQKGGAVGYDEYWFKLTSNNATLFRVYKQIAGPIYRIDNINSTYLDVYTCEPVPTSIPLNITGSEYISGPIPTDVDNYARTNISCTTDVLATYTGGNISVNGSNIQLETSINQPDVLAVDLVIEEKAVDYRSRYFTVRPEGDSINGEVSQNWRDVLEARVLDADTDEVILDWTPIHSFSTYTLNDLQIGQFRLESGQTAPTNTHFFESITGDFSVEGNIMSLCEGDDFLIDDTTIYNTYQFARLFDGCNSLISAEHLVLPATTLTAGCYHSMFQNCTVLTTTPELPAITLAEYCYYQMFSGCTSLTAAPELPATTLADFCYRYMFLSCTSLNYIKCLATDISATSCTNGWVEQVDATGIFVKDASMNDWTTGNNGIPTGWTVEDAPV